LNQVIGLTLYVIIPYAAWVLTTGLLFNKIKSPLIYNLIIHLLYVSSVLFIGFKTAQNTPPVEALTAVAAGLLLLAYYSRSKKSFLRTILTPIPYLIILATYVLEISW